MVAKKDLVKLKDLSELMVELAYAALFLHNLHFTEEVRSLYRECRTITDRVQNTTRSLRNAEDRYVRSMVIHMKDIATSAVFLAELANRSKVPSVVKHALKSSDNRVIEEQVHYSSFFVGKTLADLQIRTHTKARIVAVKRNEHWIFSLPSDFRIRANDLLIAVGTAKSAKLLKEAVNKSALLVRNTSKKGLPR